MQMQCSAEKSAKPLPREWFAMPPLTHADLWIKWKRCDLVVGGYPHSVADPLMALQSQSEQNLRQYSAMNDFAPLSDDVNHHGGHSYRYA